MTEIDTSRANVEKYANATVFITPEAGADQTSAMLLALLARAEKAEDSLSQMRDAVAEIEGFSEDWPSHGNIPLAIVSGYSLHKSGQEEAEAERDTAWNDAIEAAADEVTNWHSCDGECVRLLKKEEPT